MVMLKDISVTDLLPPNAQGDVNLRSTALALDSHLSALYKRVGSIGYYIKIMRGDLTDVEADELAWQFHLNFYDPDLPIEQKRELLKNAFRFNRRKGTPAAVEELIAILFGTGQVEEWFEYGGEPGYFRVRTTDQSATNERAQEFIRAVDSVRRLSAHLESVILEETIQANDIYFGGTLHIGEFITIG
ncbi:Phage tail protein [compost metagenome]